MKILFVNSKKNQCGVHQYGLKFYKAVMDNGDFEIDYLTADKMEEIDERGRLTNADLIIVNFHPGAMRFIKDDMVKRYSVPCVAIIHESKVFNFNNLADDKFFQYAVFGDNGTTTNLKSYIESKRLFSLGRFISSYAPKTSKPEIPTFGTIGFAHLSKGYERIIEMVQKDYDSAIIRFNIPMNNSVTDDEAGARSYDERFKSLITKPNVKLEITHNFYENEEFLDYLSHNSLNIFPYDITDNHGGISSSLDYALMSRTPFAITKAEMFRHVLSYNLPITLEDYSLQQIMDGGINSLGILYKEWSIENFNLAFSKAIRNIVKNYKNITKFNRILDETARQKHASAIETLFETTPEMMSRKIPRANIQQGFCLDVIEYCLNEMGLNKQQAKLLCIGSYEDTCCDALIKMGWNVTEIEPIKNYDLNTFYDLPTTQKNSFDLVFSISVLEHVENDVEFMKKSCELMKPNGYGVFTVDYNDIENSPAPRGNFKLYTQKELIEKIIPSLDGCELLDIPEWNCTNPDFEWDGCKYTFASLIFKKGVISDN